MRTIERSAFLNCGLTDLYCYASIVPDAHKQAFTLFGSNNITLHVPAGSIEDYKAVSPWNTFQEIVALDMIDLNGDANGDGLVNVADIVTIMNYIMGITPDIFNFDNADTNNDGLIDAADVVKITNIIMGEK